MYTGNDRVKQVGALDKLAEDIYGSFPTEVTIDDVTTEEVRAWLTLSSDPRDHEMPDWFNDHDLRYLTKRVKQHFQ